MPLVEFGLAPIEEIEPWGSPPDLRLHWFGLSYGHYHLALGTDRLLEYAGEPRDVHYQLARIHEDLLSMLPEVLDPLPREVIALLRDGSVGSTFSGLREAWTASDTADESLDEAMEVLNRRALDTSYLQPSAGIWMWSYGETVVIEWDNRDRLIDGKPAWTASCGRREIQRVDFVDEMRSFHHRLMMSMDRRVDDACRNWQRPHIKIDIDELRDDCCSRAGGLDAALRRSPSDQDWSAVGRELAAMRS